MAATYTVKQVADILGYSTNSIYTFLKEKRLKSIRVGRGRFRIPQAELDRLLAPGQRDGGFSQPAAAANTAEVRQPVVQAPVSYVSPEVPYHFTPVASPSVQVEVPSLYDWFTGIASIVLGLAMYLFSGLYEEFAVSQYAAILPILRISLIAGGFGMLFSDVVGKRKSLWHLLFHGIIASVFTLYTLILFQVGNLEGIAIYGSMTLLLVLYTMLHLDGVAGFSYFVGTLFTALTMIAVISPQQSALLSMLSSVPVPVPYLTAGWIGVMIVIAICVWVGYRTNSRVFSVAMFAVSLVMTLHAVYYAQNLMWGRSLFTLLIGIISFFVPIWQTLSFSHKRDRMFVFGSFGSILCVFIIAVGAVRVMQTNIISYAGNELINKATYGKFLLESTFASAQTGLIASAANPLLIEGLETGDSDVLVGITKTMFESNTILKKIVLLSKDNTLISQYPHAASSAAEFAARDYVVRAAATKKPILSESFETAGGVTKKVVIIAIPVVTGKDALVGLLVGEINMDILSNKLQQIVTAGLEEHIIVADRNGKVVIHPDVREIGSAVVEFNESSGVGQTLPAAVREESIGGARTLAVYTPTTGVNGWVVGATTPVRSVLRVTPTATLTIFAVITISLLIVSVFLMSHKVKHAVSAGTVVPEPAADGRIGLPAAPAPSRKSIGKPRSKKSGKREDSS